MTDIKRRRLVVGTAGHIDHGKTSLVRALTGADTDRLAEEKKRGMSIELGFARWQISDEFEIDLIDVPGHEKFVGTMTSGASGIEAAILVISVEDGIMPQTREHLRVLEFLGVQSLIIALSKCDLADAEIIEWQREEINQFFETQRLKPIDVVNISIRDGLGLSLLAESLLSIASSGEGHPKVNEPILAVDRAFNMVGKGRVVTGTLRNGNVALEKPIFAFSQSSPTPLPLELKSLHRHGEEFQTVDGPARLAISFKGRDTKRIQRGDWLSSTQMVYARTVLASLAEWFPKADFPEGLEFHCGTFSRQVRVKRGNLNPGDYCILEFDRPCWLRGGLRFILRTQTAQGFETVAGGTITDALQPKFKGVFRALKVLNEIQSDKAILQYISLGARVEALTHETINVRFSSPVAKLLNKALKSRDYQDLKTREGHIAPSSHLQDARQAIIDLIKTELLERPEAKGLPESVIYSKLTRWSRAELQQAIKLGIESERLGRNQGLLRLQGSHESISKSESNVLRRVQEQLQCDGLLPQAIPDLAQSLKLSLRDVRDVIQRLHHHGELVKLAPDLYADAAVADQIIPRVVEALSNEKALTAGELKPYLVEGISRKWAIPWLEFLDRSKVTLRRGNHRTLHPSRKKS